MYPKFDTHLHATGPKAALVAVFDALGVSKALNLSFSDFLEPQALLAYEDALLVDMDKYRERFAFVPAFSVRGFDKPGYMEKTIAKLGRDIDERGAVAVKIWKDLGMMLQDAEGKYVFCDDARLQPVFDYIAARGLVVYSHIADPVAGWLPLDTPSPHTAYYRAHPEFHWHGKPGKPGHDEILGHRDALLARYPKTLFVAAHLASLEHDLELVGHFLDSFPNAFVDVAARVPDLRMKPDTEVRAFFIRHQGRILYGTDWDYEEGQLGETPDARNPSQTACIQGFLRTFAYFEEQLALPPEVLRKFYFENAAALFAARP